MRAPSFLSSAAVVVFLGLAVPVQAAGTDPVVEELPRLPPRSPEEALKSFSLSPGFTVSAAAVEPQVMDPVSLSFDDHGGLLVAEMRDYSERRAERLSRIRRLTDRDGDGVFETSAIVMDGLAWATSVLYYRGAVYVTASPDIWRLRDRNGDGTFEDREVIFTGFGEGMERLNVQALVNSLTPGPDGRIYGAAAANGGRVRRPGTAETEAVSVRGQDFSFDPETLDFRAEPGGGQFGLTFDRWGRRFVCSNSHHIQWIAPVRAGGWLPAPGTLVDIAEDGPAAPVFRLSPDEPWRVMRTNWRASGLVPGLVEGDGKASGYFTSASGIHLWRDEAIVADCGSNLVHRKQFRETVDGPVAARPEVERSREFLASTDTWFRPVSFTTGPDGALYIADMCREYIEHPDSLPLNLKAKMDLNSGNDRGRIWRVQGVKPDNTSSAASHSPSATALPSPPPGLLREITETPVEAAPEQWKGWWEATGKNPSGRAARTLLATLRNAEEAGDFFRRCSPGLTLTESLQLAAALRIPPPDSLRADIDRLAGETGSGSPERLLAVEIQSRADGGSGKSAALALALNPAENESVRLLVLRLVPEAAAQLLDGKAPSPALEKAGPDSISPADSEKRPRPPSAPSALTGNLRAAAVASLGQQPGGPVLLLEKIRQGILSTGDIPAAMAASWRSAGSPELRHLAAEILPAPIRDRSAVIAARQTALTLQGEAAKGEAVFQQRCATCHRDGESGSAVGPDRASFRNKGKPLLLLAILDPDREVAPQYARVTLTFKDGAVSAGICQSETPEAVRLILPGGQQQTAARAEIARLDRDPGSLMPVGVEEGLTHQELADLLAWLTR